MQGSPRCGLHGDGSIADRAFPLTGQLGFSSWPRLWRHLSLATYDIDAFGLDPVIAEMAWHILNMLYYDYFRVEVEGIENVPMDGGAVLVANHGGAALPYDGAMLSLAVMNEAAVPRRVRVIGTEIFNMLPGVSHMYRKVGAAYAARDDARELLRREHLLGVFPEGERGFMKPVWEAYRVGRLGRGGFAALAEDNGVRSALGTLWPVNDQGSAAFIHDFYKNVVDTSNSRETALNATQLRFIQNKVTAVETSQRGAAPLVETIGHQSATPPLPGFSHPYYWAPFVLLEGVRGH